MRALDLDGVARDRDGVRARLRGVEAPLRHAARSRATARRQGLRRLGASRSSRSPSCAPSPRSSAGTRTSPRPRCWAQCSRPSSPRSRSARSASRSRAACGRRPTSPPRTGSTWCSCSRAAWSCPSAKLPGRVADVARLLPAAALTDALRGALAHGAFPSAARGACCAHGRSGASIVAASTFRFDPPR